MIDVPTYYTYDLNGSNLTLAVGFSAVWCFRMGLFWFRSLDLAA